MSRTEYFDDDIWINWYWCKDGSTFYYIAKRGKDENNPVCIMKEDLI